MNTNRFSLVLLAGLMWMFTGCNDGNTDGSNNNATNANTANGQNKVILHALSDPEELTPLNANDNGSTIIFLNIFQTLVHLDYRADAKIIPVLAKERPKIAKLPNGKMTADMEIREEAVWDNGEPISGHDIDFSLRVLKNPLTNSKALKPYLEDIEDIIVDENNPKKFTLIYAKPYMAPETALTDFYIIPSYVYDKEGIMKKFTVNDLYKNGEKLSENADIKKFADHYNGSKFQREIIVGSGPYTFDDWKVNQRVVLKLKPDWWGHKVKDSNMWFDAYPKELIFETINDLTTASVALKGEKVDAMYGIEPKVFVTDLSESKKFKEKFSLHNPPLFSYDYMAINKRLDKFSDVRTRKALAHIMNVDQLIESFTYGLGVPVATFEHPILKKRISPNVKPYPHDPNKALQLLSEAGWKDTDGDGTLDKEIDGEKVDFTILLNYNQGNSRREKACLIFQEECRKVGIEVDVRSLEWSVLLERNRAHNFEMFVLGWISSPLEYDPKQIWHTDSYEGGGSNYTGFGNGKSDAIIDALRQETDDAKRYKYYHELQEIIYEDVPYIFLLAQKERIAISKKFGNTYASGIRPGYRAAGFQVATPTPN